MTLRLHAFAWKALERQAAELGMEPEDLLGFSLLYYLADLDSGRISRRIDLSPRGV